MTLRSVPLLRFAVLVVLMMMIAIIIMPSAAFAADGSTPSVLADTASWGLLAGFLTPLAVSVVNQPQWSKRTRTAVSAVAAVIVAIVTLLASGSFNDGPQTVLSVVTLVLVTSAASYRAFWAPLGAAPAIENATSKASGGSPDSTT